MAGVNMFLLAGGKPRVLDVLLFEYGGWVGWGGILTFMYLAYIRGCYAAATSQTWSQKHLGDRRCPMLP